VNMYSLLPIDSTETACQKREFLFVCVCGGGFAVMLWHLYGFHFNTTSMVDMSKWTTICL
jgi:hypothetical protein